MGSIEPFTLIEGPEAWTAADYRGRTDWINNLTEQHISELDAAISGVVAKGIKDRDIHVSPPAVSQPAASTSAQDTPLLVGARRH